MLQRAVVVSTLAALAFLSGPARADRERPVSVGPYAGVDLGVRGAVGKNRPYVGPGPSLALHAGSDLFSWLSLGGRLELSSHEATVPPPPEGEYFQIYSAGGEARLSLRVLRMSVYAEGALGLAAVSTNILEKVDILEAGERFSPMLSAGGGLEYQLQNRHYALGLAGQWSLLSAFERLQTWDGRLYLRYTY